MRKIMLLIICLSVLPIGGTAFAGGLSSIIDSYKQIKHDYQEYHKMQAFDQDGNLQPHNIRVYMEGKNGAQEVTGKSKQQIVDGSGFYRAGKKYQYKRIPQSNEMKQVQDMNRLFDKLGIYADNNTPTERKLREWEIPVDEGMTVITRRVIR